MKPIYKCDHCSQVFTEPETKTVKGDPDEDVEKCPHCGRESFTEVDPQQDQDAAELCVDMAQEYVARKRGRSVFQKTMDAMIAAARGPHMGASK